MSAPELLESDANHPQRLPNIFESAPILTSDDDEWKQITLETHYLPPEKLLNTASIVFWSLSHLSCIYS